MRFLTRPFIYLKNWKQQLFYFLLSPVFIAFVLAIIIILFLPGYFEKYKIELVAKHELGNNAPPYFTDLDGDGISENIVLTRNVIGNPALKLRWKEKRNAFAQFNFIGEITNANSHRRSFHIGDYNDDGLKEIYLPIIRDDSIFLHVIEAFGKKHFVKERFIDTIFQKIGKYDIEFIQPELIDINGDNKEFIFILSAGFSLYPRKIYVYDIDTDQFYSNPKIGAYINAYRLFDFQRDGSNEIVLSTIAYDNIKNNLDVPYIDSCSWLITLDNQLNFKYKPTAFEGVSGNIKLNIFDDKILLSHINKHKKNGRSSKFYWINYKDNELIKYEEPFFSLFKSNIIHIFNDRIIQKSAGQNSKLYCIDKKLTFSDSLSLRNNESYSDARFHDLNNDGKTEIIFEGGSRFLITQPCLKHPLFINVGDYVNTYGNKSRFFASIYQLGDKQQNLLSLANNEIWLIFNYYQNPLYPLQYALYIGIFLIIWLFIWSIRKLYQVEMNRRNSIYKELSQTKALLFQSQMDPHFIHNTLNAVAASIFSEEKRKAYDNLLKFSRLSRMIIDNNDAISRTLEEEVIFVRYYLDIQKFRFSNQFNYRIEQNENVDKYQQVPKMFLHTYVENSIRHGIRPKKGEGHLTISIKSNGNYVIVIIEDDGIGRNKSAEMVKNTTGRGLKTINALYDIFNTYNPKNIKEHFEDIIDEKGKICGTRVTVHIPYGYSFEIP